MQQGFAVEGLARGEGDRPALQIAPRGNQLQQGLDTGGDEGAGFEDQAIEGGEAGSLKIGRRGAPASWSWSERRSR